MGKEKRRRQLLRFLVFFSLIGGIVFLETVSCIILKTSMELLFFVYDAQQYNAQAVKTDEMTERFLESQKERQKIYNSDNVIVRVYSNANIVVKLAVLEIAFAYFLGFPYAVFAEIRRRNKMKARRKFLKWRLERAMRLAQEETDYDMDFFEPSDYSNMDLF